MVPIPPWWLEEALAGKSGSTAQASQARPRLETLPIIASVLDCDNRHRRHFTQVTNLFNSLIMGGFIQQTSQGVFQTQSYVHTSTRNPTVNDDGSLFFVVGSWWINTVTLTAWLCIDITIGAAVWKGWPVSSSPGTGGPGTVQNASGPASFLSWSGAGTDTLTASLISQTANLVFASPDGAAGTPAFRQLKETDLAGFTDVTTANASSSQHGLLPKLSGSSTDYLDGTGAWDTASGGGAVVGTGRTINTTSPITGGGDLSADRTMVVGGLSSLGTAKYVVGVNSGATAWEYKQILGVANETNVSHGATTITIGIVDPLIAGKGGTGFASYVGGDILYADSSTTAFAKLAHVSTATRYLANDGGPTYIAWSQVNLANGVSGTLAATTGGTGVNTVTQGDLIYGSASNVWSKLAKDANATRSLTNTGASNNPAWAQVDLTTGVTGVLPIANGGTGSGDLDSYVSTQLDATTTTLGAITGLSATLTAAHTYAFEITLFVDATALGGHKYSLNGGTATATTLIAHVDSVSDSSNLNVITTRLTSLAGTAGQAGSTGYLTVIRGTIIVNGGGTFIPQFAQNVANGTSSVLVGSSMTIKDIT